MVTTVTNNSPQAINTSLFSLEKDTDEKAKLLNERLNDVNSAIAEINKILDGLNKDANVISVNGKTGIVTLDASDVGALPDSTVIPDAQVNSDWNATSGVAEILHKPNLAAVATSGSYNDLSNKPTIPTATSQLTNDSDFVTSSGRVANATYADTFRTTYISHITPAQAAAMVEGNRSWPLSYNKNYIQSVNVTWDSYQQHNFPAGAAGYFFPGYGSNGGTLVLVNYPSNRMLYNVWIDSKRWSGWHYVDLSPITYS